MHNHQKYKYAHTLQALTLNMESTTKRWSQYAICVRMKNLTTNGSGTCGYVVHSAERPESRRVAST